MIVLAKTYNDPTHNKQGRFFYFLYFYSLLIVCVYLIEKTIIDRRCYAVILFLFENSLTNQEIQVLHNGG
jgi:hypothetical protein